MFGKKKEESVGDVLTAADDVVERLEAAASRTADKAEEKNTDVMKLTA